MESALYSEHQKNFSKISAKNKSKIDLSLPTQDDIDECTQRTRLAIQELLQKLNELADNTPKEMYVRYTPSSSVLDSGSTTAKQRIIKIVNKQVDPMLPPKFKNNQKTPALPDQLMAETAVLRGLNKSASNKTLLSKEERQQWNIPAAISNWKNQKGFAIAIDKRLASGGSYSLGVDDGGIGGEMINKKFSVLAQSLHSADLKAREDIRARHRLKVKQAQQKKLEAEKKLQDLALQVNEARRNDRKRYIKETSYESKSDEQRISDRKKRLADYEKKMKRSKLSEDQKILSLTNNDQRIAIGLSRDANNHSESGRLHNMDPDSNDIFVGTAPRFVSSSTNLLYDAPLFNQHEAISNIYTTKNSGNSTFNRMVSTIKSFKGGVSADGERSGGLRFTKETLVDTSSSMTRSTSNDADYGLKASKHIETKSRWDDDDDDDDD